MDWLGIMKIVMAVLSLIIQYLGGGALTGTGSGASQSALLRSNATPYSCGQPYWTDSPEMVSGNFVGTVAIDCYIQGNTGGGLPSLNSYLISQVPAHSTQIFSGPTSTDYESLPSQTFNHSLTIAPDTNSDPVAIRGNTNIATDGVSDLRHVFASTQIPSGGAVGYLQDMTDEVEVIPGDSDGWYYARLIYHSNVARPAGISAGDFLEQMTQSNETNIQNRSQGDMATLAEHL